MKRLTLVLALYLFRKYNKPFKNQIRTTFMSRTMLSPQIKVIVGAFLFI